MTQHDIDRSMMALALKQARLAEKREEVPVGAVLVDAEGDVLAAGGNNCIHGFDPTGHAEIVVLRQAATICANYRLPGTTMYVTLESCTMCAGAMLHARVARIVYGADDPKAGALHSVYRIGGDDSLNHRFDITGGVRQDECATLLREFFRRRRYRGKNFLSKMEKIGR